MYVCLCMGVSDKEIQDLVASGADTVTEVMRCSGAGTRCGTCRPTIAKLVEGGCESASPGSVSTLRVLRRASSAV
jgi:bacterioferritin-associated ferredoxin